MRTPFPLFLILTLLAPAAVRAQAQATPPGPPDPLLQIMMAQPPMDTTSPVEAVASFEPPAIRPGEQSTYRVTFNALLAAVQWPEEIIAPRQLDLRPGARGEFVRLTPTNQQPQAAFNYRVRASAPGSFTVPRFLVYVYGKPVTVPAARLEVAANAPELTARPPRLRLGLSTTNVFLGQPVTVRLLLPGSKEGVVEGLTQVQINGDGFMVDTSQIQQRIEAVPLDGRNGAAFIHETVIMPLEAGPLTLTAQAFTAGNTFAGGVVVTGPATIPGGPPQYVLVDSDPATVNVKPLPRERERPGFNGAIGIFTNDPPTLETNIVTVGEPVALTVIIRGQSGLGRLIAPAAPRVRNWRVFDATSDDASPQAVQARGFAKFTYTLIPTTEEARATPALPFSFFDPHRGEYVDLTIPPVPVTVKPGTQPADLAALTQLETAGDGGKREPALSGLAATPGRTARSLATPHQGSWFLQLTPALVFVGLWLWDRRRRYLERHPDIVLRRRARHALRREWRALRKAAQAGDAPRFADCAVRAMRAACAPHYPAEPRALVGADVLPLLKPEQQQARAGEVVRRVFTIADANSFNTQPADAGELLSLQAELERVLEQLEAKL